MNLALPPVSPAINRQDVNEGRKSCRTDLSTTFNKELDSPFLPRLSGLGMGARVNDHRFNLLKVGVFQTSGVAG